MESNKRTSERTTEGDPSAPDTRVLVSQSIEWKLVGTAETVSTSSLSAA